MTGGCNKSQWAAAVLWLIFGPALLPAQYETVAAERIEMHLDELEEKADEVVKVNLWGKSLEQGKKLLSLRKNVTSPVSRFLAGLKGVYRRTYRFAGAKPEPEDVEPIYRQLADDGWAPLIETENREERAPSRSIRTMKTGSGRGHRSSHRPEEVTVVRIMGSVDLEVLSDIGKGLGLPMMHIASTELAGKKIDLSAAK